MTELETWIGHALYHLETGYWVVMDKDAKMLEKLLYMKLKELSEGKCNPHDRQS